MARSGTKPHAELQGLLPFERLLAEISALFINLPADQIDNEIDAAQRRICEFLDLDRSTLWITPEDDPEMLLLAHIHQPPELLSPPRQMRATDFYPWSTQKVLDGETVAISKMTELPVEADRDRENYHLYGAKSTVVVPLTAGRRRVFGALSFAVTRSERDWSSTALQQFQLVAQIFANALARKRAELELVKSEKKIRLITNALPVLIAYVDADQRYRFNNETYRAWFGISPEEAFGRTMREVVGEGFYRSVLPYVERALSGEQVRFAQDLELGEGRMVSVEAIYVPDLDEGGFVRGLYVLAMDVTERNFARQESKRLQDELLHAGRISTMGELAGALAHEINQPLSAIMSNAQAALRYLNAPSPDMNEVREILGDIVKEDGRASEVILRLRSLLKKATTEFELLDLNSVFQEVIGLLRGDAVLRNIAVAIELDPGLPPVRGDRIQLQQVALNLMLNAFEAMNERAKGERRILIRTGRKDDQVLASAADNGKGVPIGEEEKIFKPFYTSKPQGLGMGLSICRSIINSHHGRLWVENNPDGGATFYFSLPIPGGEPIPKPT
jgi:PAS domain S-box-containing protein